MKALFITWDGPDQNYLESLFFPIFSEVQSEKLSIDTLQFSWGSVEQIRQIAAQAQRLGLQYHHKPVLRRPLTLATAGMIFKGAVDIISVVKSSGITVLFPRSLICAAMASLARRWLPAVRVFFDADGFMADERVDFGGWKSQGGPYRLFREVEAQTVRQADLVMTRTAAAKEMLIVRAGPDVSPEKIRVISNGADESRFVPGTAETRRRLRQTLEISEQAPVMIYVGSMGKQYLPQTMLKVFEQAHALNSETRFIVLTGQGEEASKLFRDSRLPSSSLAIRRVASHEVPLYVAAADLGVALREPTLSQRGVCPLKVGEYLLCGTPVLSTSGIGDLDEQLPGGSVSYFLDHADQIGDAICWFEKAVRQDRDDARLRCRAAGLSGFSLINCVKAYSDAFEQLAADNKPAQKRDAYSFGRS